MRLCNINVNAIECFVGLNKKLIASSCQFKKKINDLLRKQKIALQTILDLLNIVSIKPNV